VNTVEKKSLAPAGNRNPAVQPVARRYTKLSYPEIMSYVPFYLYVNKMLFLGVCSKCKVQIYRYCLPEERSLGKYAYRLGDVAGLCKERAFDAEQWT
jgi:hypothetical protein